MTLDAADNLTINCFRDAMARGMQARQLCKGRDNVKDESKAALQERQQRKGGNDVREVIVVALLF